MFDIKLYVASRSEEAGRISSTLRKALARKCDSDFSLTVVNVLEQPHLADRDGILATPTAVRFSPAPQVRVIGNFRDMDIVLKKLGLENGGGDGSSNRDDSLAAR